ncbi:hypothetical protein ACFWNR_22450 [Streptomyces virginiae]|uniref:hypothetical protein n=1 Tax=Streptomyces virginiae TaxID=1961 RepID=UPI00365D8AB7
MTQDGSSTVTPVSASTTSSGLVPERDGPTPTHGSTVHRGLSLSGRTSHQSYMPS